jgi:hypothetical protein
MVPNVNHLAKAFRLVLNLKHIEHERKCIKVKVNRCPIHPSIDRLEFDVLKDANRIVVFGIEFWYALITIGFLPTFLPELPALFAIRFSQ